MFEEEVCTCFKKHVTVMLQLHTSTIVVLAALHMGWLKFLAVFLTQTKTYILNKM